jgi:pimeloyl-ACP methyl ester carboxylesterase
LQTNSLKDSSPQQSTVLLLPGMTLNCTIFPHLALPTIEIDFNDLIVSEDGTPGIGSDAMKLYEDLLDQHLAESAAWGSRRRIVVGHSFGGMLALRWLLRHGCRGPARIDGLVLIAATGGPMYDVVRLRLAHLGKLDVGIGMTWLIRGWNTRLVTRSMKRLLSKGRLTATRVDFTTLRRKTDGALDLAGWRNTDWRAMRTYRLAMVGFDERQRLGGIDVPTIVLHGSEDTIFPPEVGERLADAMPDAEFRLVAGAAHGLPLTHGADVARAVADLTEGNS